MKKIERIICLSLYYGIAYYLPDSYGIGGKYWNAIRIALVKRFVMKCGKIRTINRRVDLGSGRMIEIGDESGIGSRTHLSGKVIIGNHVILSRDCMIWHANHEYMRTDIPINNQGMRPSVPTIIEDDVWIGMRSMLTPGRHVAKGTLVAMGSVLTKDFPEYSVVGGNPAKFIKSRKG